MRKSHWCAVVGLFTFCSVTWITSCQQSQHDPTATSQSENKTENQMVSFLWEDIPSADLPTITEHLRFQGEVKTIPGKGPFFHFIIGTFVLWQFAQDILIIIDEGYSCLSLDTRGEDIKIERIPSCPPGLILVTDKNGTTQLNRSSLSAKDFLEVLLKKLK